MLKLSLISFAACGMAMTALADDSQAFPGDADFLTDAYEAAETGRDFSYARQWGSRQAYDGTDTSQYYDRLVAAAAERRAPDVAPQRRANLITRAAAPAPAKTATRSSLRGRLSD